MIKQMKVKTDALNLLAIFACVVNVHVSLWWLIPLAVFVGMCFVSPRWDKQKGWRFKHGD